MKISLWIKKSVLQLFFVTGKPRLEAEIILRTVIKKSRSWILAYPEKNLTKIQIKKLNFLIRRRILGEPISYLTGNREFWSLNFKVNYNTFIPRHDSELLVEKTLFYISSTPSLILDLGTGCGALALAIAKERPDCFIVGVDYCNNIINIAKYNAKKLKIKNVKFVKSNWFNNLKNNFFDIIISNPPYLSKIDPHLNGEIRFEPVKSLISKKNGLADITYIINNSKYFIKKNGFLLCEHGWNQSVKIKKIFQKNNFHNINTYLDYKKIDRITVGMVK